MAAYAKELCFRSKYPHPPGARFPSISHSSSCCLATSTARRLGNSVPCKTFALLYVFKQTVINNCPTTLPNYHICSKKKKKRAFLNNFGGFQLASQATSSHPETWALCCRSPVSSGGHPRPRLSVPEHHAAPPASPAPQQQPCSRAASPSQNPKPGTSRGGSETLPQPHSAAEVRGELLRGLVLCGRGMAAHPVSAPSRAVLAALPPKSHVSTPCTASRALQASCGTAQALPRGMRSRWRGRGLLGRGEPGGEELLPSSWQVAHCHLAGIS